jgi:hypothetical protein
VHAGAILLKDAYIMITDQPLLLPPDTEQGEIAHSFEDYLMTLPDKDKSLLDALIMEHSCYDMLEVLKNALNYMSQKKPTRHTHYSSVTDQQEIDQCPLDGHLACWTEEYSLHTAPAHFQGMNPPFDPKDMACYPLPDVFTICSNAVKTPG